jgi:MFS family permease
MLENLRSSPRTFKVLVASALIENTAFGLIIPYLTLYMVNDVLASEPENTAIFLAGMVLMTYTLAGMPSILLGGALADKIGRKPVLLSSLGLMSVTILMYFFADSFWALVFLAFADSFVGSMYMPAANAMIADIIPPAQRPKAYSTLRIAWNVGIIFGPVLGFVLVAAYSIRTLFIFGALILAIAFVMNLVFIRETRPKDSRREVITLGTVLGVAKDRPFLVLCALSAVFWFFFSQWIAVLPVYAFNELGIEENRFGILFAVSAAMTVALQLWVTSKTVNMRRSVVLMVGQIICAIGFALIFLATDFSSLLACIVVITIGELIYMSIISAIVADFAPGEKRGTYMGFSGLVQTLGSGVGFLFGMWLLGTLSDKEQVWLVFGAIGLVSSIGYVFFARIIGPERDRPFKSLVKGPEECGPEQRP